MAEGIMAGKMAGKPLCPAMGFAAYTGTAADWKWAAEELRYECHYNTDSICEWCPATKSGGATDYARSVVLPGEDAVTWETSPGAALSPLSRIPKCASEVIFNDFSDFSDF